MFYWSNGDQINPSFWGGSNPSNSNGPSWLVNEGCVAYSAWDNNMLNDAGCSELFDYICEIQS